MTRHASFSTAGFFNQEMADAYDRRNSALKPISDGLHFLMRLVLNDLPADARLLCVGVGTGAHQHVHLNTFATHLAHQVAARVQHDHRRARRFRHIMVDQRLEQGGFSVPRRSDDQGVFLAGRLRKQGVPA